MGEHVLLGVTGVIMSGKKLPQVRRTEIGNCNVPIILYLTAGKVLQNAPLLAKTSLL